MKFTAPSGRVYNWDKPNPPTQEDIDALVKVDAQQGGQAAAPAPAAPQKPSLRDVGLQAIASAGDQIPSTFDLMQAGIQPGSMPVNERALVTGAKLAAETIPMSVGQFYGGVPGGMIGGGLGNIASQGIEYLASGKPMSAAEVPPAMAWGGLPIAGQIGRAKGIIGTGAEALSEAARLGGAGVTIGTAQTLAEQGRMPTLPEMGQQAAAPAALGLGGGLLQQYGQGAIDRAQQAARFLGLYGKTDIQPSPGMLDPARFAKFEAREIERNPTGRVASTVDAAYRDLGNNLADVVEAKMQPSEVWQAWSQRVQGAKAKSEEVLNNTLNNALEDARQTALQGLIKGGKPLNPAEARDAIAGVVGRMDEAYNSHWDRMYSMFNSEAPVFNTSSILRKAENIYGSIGEDVPNQLKAILGAENGNRASLDAIRNVQQQLAKKGRIGEAEVGLVQGKLQKLAGEIADDLQVQAERIWPKDVADQFKAVNQDYRAYSDLWGKPGVEAFYAKNPTDESVTKLVNGVMRNGLKADEYANVSNLIANLATPQKAAPVITMAGGAPILGTGQATVASDLARTLQGHLNDLVRGNIIQSAADGGVVKGSELVKRLNKLGNDPEALKAFGFGNMDTVKELETLVNDFPSASSLTTDQWSQLFSSPAFKRSFETGVGLSQVLEPAMANSSGNNNLTRALFFRSAGLPDKAEEYLGKAADDFKKAGVDFSQVQAKYNQLAASPEGSFFNKPSGITPQDYDTLIKQISNTDANKTTNQWVSELKNTLKAGEKPGDNQLLLGLQRGYIRDHLIQWENAGKESAGPTRIGLSTLAEFLAPNSKKGAAELERAKALLEPEQLKAMNDAIEAASSMRYYERVAGGQQPKRAGGLSDRGIVSRGLDVIDEWWKQGQWDKVADALANPKAYQEKLFVKGQAVRAAGQAIERAAPSLQKFLSQPAPPTSLMQFAQPQPTR